MIKKIFLLLVLFFTSASVPKSEMTVDSIQKQLLSQQWSIGDRESVAEREARARNMARALHDAAELINPKIPKKHLVGAAIVVWWQETRFSLEVHQGGRTRWGSDDGRAKCFGQIHEQSVGIKLQEGETLQEFRARQKALWSSLAGTDYESTKRCAEATMRQLLSKYSNCSELSGSERWLGAFGDYGSGGNSCQPGPTSEKRLKRLQQIVPKL